MVVDFERKQGESVVISLVGLDSGYDQMSRTDHQVNGLSNAEANMIYESVSGMVSNFMKQLADQKAKGKGTG